MGRSFKALGVPVGEVLSSPTFRALQTVRLAGFGTAKAVPELGDGGQSMSAVGADPAAWLRRAVAASPRAGTDTVIVTHVPNLVAAFGEGVADTQDSETLVFHPDGRGQAELVARVKAEAWAGLQGAP
jgi:phosphohistidine phosphatase SixA